MQKSFGSGEISPSLYARTDLAKYQTSLRTCKNMMVMRHGGVTNRAGTKFIGEVKDSSAAVRLIPFIYSQDQAYVLEFGNLTMRVIKDDDYVKLTAQAITAITNANPCVVTYTGADNYANGDQVYISGITGAIGDYLNGRTFKVAGLNAGANTFQLNYLDGTAVNSTGFGSYTSGGTVEEIYTLTTVYSTAELPELKYSQIANTLIITVADNYPRKVTRVSDTSWSLDNALTGNNLNTQTNMNVSTVGAAGAVTATYLVTSVLKSNGQESPVNFPVTPQLTNGGIYTPVYITTSNATLSATNYNRLRWEVTTTGVGDQDTMEFNVYKLRDGAYYYIGTASGHETYLGNEVTYFNDIGYTLQSETPPAYNSTTIDWLNNDNGPSAVTFYQQRLVFANSDAETEKAWASNTGDYYNFSSRVPLTDSDALEFSLAGSRVNAINHLLDIGPLVLFTQSGEFVVNNNSGTLTPSNIDVRPVSYNGSSKNVAPVVVGNSAVYVQARGSAVRDLNYQYESNGYAGNELSVYASHLIDDYTIVDMGYQQVPHSIVWCVRSDGVLLGLTYLKDQQMVAWHQHTFENGTVENICVIPSSSAGEDDVYVVVNRTINGATKRYVERLTTRKIADVKDIAILDSHLVYDGRNTGVRTMTLSGSGWTYTDTLTLTASSAYFSASEVGNRIDLYDTDGSVIRCTITAYTSTTVVSVLPNRTVPVSMQAVAITEWTRSVDEIKGLWHLEGQSVSVYADGYVIASPNNSDYDVITVTNGAITLPNKYGVINIGLPITADVQTLNIDGANTIIDRNKLISKVTLYVEESRGIWAGTRPPDETVDMLDGLTELKIRNDEGYDSPTDLETDPVDIITEATWNNNGRVFIRQVDPLPLTILSITPSGFIPFAGG